MNAKTSILMIAFLCITCLSHANEIHLKDGRIIKALTCWEEDGAVKYQKYGGIISIPYEKVQSINYDTPADLGYEHYLSGRYIEAIILYNDALLNDYNNPELWLMRGQCFASLDRYQDALACFANALQYCAPDPTTEKEIEAAVSLTKEKMQYWLQKLDNEAALQRAQEAQRQYEQRSREAFAKLMSKKRLTAEMNELRNELAMRKIKKKYN
jgi:tetratricopeptide (TPR) repeat protein